MMHGRCWLVCLPCSCFSFSPGQNSEQIVSILLSISHGMRNELSRSKEVTPDRSWLHLWLRGSAFSRSSEHLGRREAGGVRSRHRVPALLIHERGGERCVEKAS